MKTQFFSHQTNTIFVVKYSLKIHKGKQSTWYDTKQEFFKIVMILLELHEPSDPFSLRFLKLQTLHSQGTLFPKLSICLTPHKQPLSHQGVYKPVISSFTMHKIKIKRTLPLFIKLFSQYFFYNQFIVFNKWSISYLVLPTSPHSFAPP